MTFPNTHYPLFLDISEKPCLVAGGGGVGARKTASLLDAGAKVTVISPDVSERIQQWADKGDVVWLKRAYKKGDAEGFFLCFAATPDKETNRRIQKDASFFGALCNVADASAPSDFMVPSSIQRGSLTIAVSTGGKSPALAKKIRKELEERYDDAYDAFITLMGDIRKVLLRRDADHVAHKRIFTALVESDILDLLKKNKNIDAALADLFQDEADAQAVLKDIHDQRRS